MTRVRLVAVSDCGKVMDMIQRQLAETAPHLPFEKPRAVEFFHEMIRTGDPAGWVAERDGHLTGWASGRMFGYRFCSGLYTALEAIYVCPEARGSRAAAGLLKEFVRWSRMIGAREIFLENSNGFHVPRTSRLIQAVTGAEPCGVVHRIIRG